MGKIRKAIDGNITTADIVAVTVDLRSGEMRLALDTDGPVPEEILVQLDGTAFTRVRNAVLHASVLSAVGDLTAGLPRVDKAVKP